MLRLPEDLEWCPPLEHPLNARSEVSLPPDHVHAFAKIAFVVRVAATERNETGGEQTGRLPILGEGTLGAEQFKTRHASLEQFEALQPVAKQSIFPPERMRDQTQATLP